MKMVKLLLAGSALAFAGGALAATQADYDKALAAANAAVKQAKAAGGEWRDTGKVLKAAAAAAAKGDFDTAVKQANKARFQGEMGTLQAKAEMGVGNPKYVLE